MARLKGHGFVVVVCIINAFFFGPPSVTSPMYVVQYQLRNIDLLQHLLAFLLSYLVVKTPKTPL
jgi:hypothetical protein